MADIQDTREFHTEVVEVCAALEGMLPWLEQESSDLGSVQRPIIRRLREVLDAADSVCGQDMPN